MNRNEYLIGDVASLIGVSRDTLRLYEKKGILSVRKKENGYRYYTDDDIFELSSVFYHRKMNIGLEKIENLWSGNISYQSNAAIAEEKIQEEEEAIARHQQALVRLRTFQQECQKINKHLGQFSLRNFPDAYIIEHCASQQDGLFQWFQLSQKASGLDMSYTYDTFICNGTQHQLSLIFQKSTLLLYKELVDQLNLSFHLKDHPSTKTQNCLYTIVESSSRIPETGLIREMITWGKDHGYEVEGTAVSDYIMHGMDNGKITFYLEVYMPIITSHK